MPIHISGTGSFIPKNKVDNNSFSDKVFLTNMEMDMQIPMLK